MESSRKTMVIEVNLISAQDLLLPSKSSLNKQTYVTAWIDPTQKLTSRIVAGIENPTWNDKFIFAIDRDLEFGGPNSTLVFEIYHTRRFRKDKCIGVVRVSVDSLIDKHQGRGAAISGKFMAFHVRTQSGIPRGILNIGVVNLEGLFPKAMPAFLGSSLAITED